MGLKPILKWAGGKRQLIDELKALMPPSYNTYYEPFIGGGALFFELMPEKAIINDLNVELLSVYKSFLDDAEYNKLIEKLDFYQGAHSEEEYYNVRSMDRKADFNDLSISDKAARVIYLNKACFNGIYRVNSKGFFNVPSGKKEKVILYDRLNFEGIKSYFNSSNITILNQDFGNIFSDVREGDFVYFDPPYDMIDEKKSFTSYTKENFGKEEQIRLASLYKRLNDLGVFVMLSNHNTEFIRNLYKDFNIHVVKANRFINSDSKGRGPVEEVIITNY